MGGYGLAMSELLTPADLAERLRVTEHQLHELRRKHSWPCVRFSPKVIRFTPEQVEQIIERHTVAEPTPTSPPPLIPGQTARSAARNRRL